MPRQLVIADIHGYAATFQSLLKQVGLTKEDRLFLLGDYINRGPSSAEVIDTIIGLREQGYQIIALAGNHEQMALDSHANRLQANEPYRAGLQKRRKLVDPATGLLWPHYHDFFLSLLPYYELPHHILVHAGLNFDIENPFEDTKAMSWVKNFAYDAKKAKGKTIIHGHVTKPLAQIQEAIQEKRTVICLDNGCYKQSDEGYGNLCCLDIDTYELYICSGALENTSQWKIY